MANNDIAKRLLELPLYSRGMGPVVAPWTLSRLSRANDRAFLPTSATVRRDLVAVTLRRAAACRTVSSPSRPPSTLRGETPVTRAKQTGAKHDMRAGLVDFVLPATNWPAAHSKLQPPLPDASGARHRHGRTEGAPPFVLGIR
jgi:hypothetical protein